WFYQQHETSYQRHRAWAAASKQVHLRQVALQTNGMFFKLVAEPTSLTGFRAFTASVVRHVGRPFSRKAS
ncbi:MAG: hypothetical protein RMJ16_04910, partial [Thermoguttaceae bacterium]|nr:hypothetical protein [Thermoguttaceae bacterium]